MKFLFDLFPVLLFFIAYKFFGIYAATAVAIVASFVQVGVFWYKERRFETMHLVTLALIVVFGGTTLLLKDEMFIKWKPSVLNWLFGVAFLVSQFIRGKNLTQRMLGNSVSLPAPVWVRLNLSWAAFFIAVGFANLYVVYHFDTDTWVNFKLFGIIGLTLVFVILQAIYLSRHMQHISGEEK